jgi:hypothetical protein
MNVLIKKVSRKLTGTILAQIQEATMKDMDYAINNGTILGYINPSGIRSNRVFLILNEQEDYRIITNREWKISEADKAKLYAIGRTKSGLSSTLEKKFSSEFVKIEFLNLFKTIKKIALENHIYI